MEAKELKKLLDQYDNEYYNLDTPSISDAEYDAIKSKYLKAINKEEYDYIPGQASNKFNKFKHTTNVSSLNKVKILEEDKLRKEIIRLFPVVIENKFDGLTLVTYDDNTHVTRGNGSIGEIVTKNVQNIKGIGKAHEDYPVRSEALMTQEDFERINKKREKENKPLLKTLRNGAAGIVRNIKEDSNGEGVTVYAYDLIGFKGTEEEKLKTLKNLGWNTADYYIPKDIEDAIKYIKKFDRSKLNYDIDGLVVKHNGIKQFGETEHHPNNAIAVKFVSQSKWTRILDVEWNVGKTGVISPTAILEPVEIDNTIIEKATLNNYQYIKALDINTIYVDNYHRTMVLVEKSNDVIPKIVDSKIEIDKDFSESDGYVKSINDLQFCPHCYGEVKIEEKRIFCSDRFCPGRIESILIAMANKDAFDIEDLSEKTARKLIKKYFNKIDNEIKNLNPDIIKEKNKILELEELKKTFHQSFIFDLSLEDIKSLDGFALKSANKLYENIQKSREITFDKFLLGCCIPLIGKKTAKDIATAYYNPNKTEVDMFIQDKYNNFKYLSSIKGIGPETIKNLQEYYDSSIIPFGYRNLKIKDFIPQKKADNQYTFVITGDFTIPRQKIKTIIEEAGHKVTTSISKKTSYLLASPERKSSQKYKKAKELNIKIINSLKQLNNILKGE